jgi:hypothetical protein
MKKYAVKAMKGKEFFYSKKDVIELGNRSKEILDYAINALNDLKTGYFACKDNEVWCICDDEYLLRNYATFKAVIGKNGFRVNRTSW